MCRVEWELWTSTNDGCGSSCDRQATFKIQMRDAAVELQKVLPAQRIISQPNANFRRLPEPQQQLRSDWRHCGLCAFRNLPHVKKREIVYWHDEFISNLQPG